MENNIKKAPVKFWEDLLYFSILCRFLFLLQISDYHHLNNKGMDIIDLPSIFRDKSVQLSIPYYFKNCELPIICYKYNKSIRGAIFNFNKLVSDIDIETYNPVFWDCKDSKYVYPAAGHVITGNLRIISDSRVCWIIANVLNIAFFVQIDFQKCRKNCSIF